jgi:DNA-binding phage protein
MEALAANVLMGRASLYKALSGEGNPGFATIFKVVTP